MWSSLENGKMTDLHFTPCITFVFCAVCCTNPLVVALCISPHSFCIWFCIIVCWWNCKYQMSSLLFYSWKHHRPENNLKGKTWQGCFGLINLFEDVIFNNSALKYLKNTRPVLYICFANDPKCVSPILDRLPWCVVRVRKELMKHYLIREHFLPESRQFFISSEDNNSHHPTLLYDFIKLRLLFHWFEWGTRMREQKWHTVCLTRRHRGFGVSMWHKIELKGLILSVALVRTYIIKFSEVNPVILLCPNVC